MCVNCFTLRIIIILMETIKDFYKQEIPERLALEPATLSGREELDHAPWILFLRQDIPVGNSRDDAPYGN